MSAVDISGNGVIPASCPFFPSKQTFVGASGNGVIGCSCRAETPYSIPRLRVGRLTSRVRDLEAAL